MRSNTPEGQYVIASVMLSIAVMAVSARVYSRHLRSINLLSWDDYTILAALLFTFGQAVGMWIGATKGGLGQHARIDPDTGFPFLDSTFEIFWKVNFASLLTGTLAIGLTKISVLLLYRRIFSGITKERCFSIATWTLIVFAICWTIAFFFTSLFQCRPIYENWIGYGSPAGHCMNETIMYLSQAWTDAISDLLILLVPVPCVWSLRMPLKQKFAVTGMFLLGAVTLSISITKLVYYYQIISMMNSADVDLTYILTPTVYWPMIESSLGITGACLPLLKPIFDDCFPALRSRLNGNKTRPLNNVKTHGTVVSTRGEFDSEKGGRMVIRSIDVSFGDYETPDLNKDNTSKWILSSTKEKM